MDWIDYRERLGMGFDDSNKTNLFYTRVSNAMILITANTDNFVTPEEYYKFCHETGTRMDFRLMRGHNTCELLQECFRIINDHKGTFEDYLSFFVWFINCLDEMARRTWGIEGFKNLLLGNLEDAHIQYELLENDGKIFVFPKGAKELDDALISEPLDWLKDYPLAHKTYIIALKQYADGIYIRDVADNLRKTLEAFLQEFLKNTKNLETNKNEICRYLGEQGVDGGISGLFQPLINAYKNINDKIAKHNDAVDAKLLEFLLYQTGVLIRMVLSVKQAQDMEENDNAH